MKRRNVFLITGGCGFIGSSVVARLSAQDPGAVIRVLDNFKVGTPDDLAEVAEFDHTTAQECTAYEGVVLVEGDVRDSRTAALCARDVNCIVHLAANTGVGPSVDDPRQDMDCNVVGTFNMLEAARQNKVERFVFASSGAPVGEVEPPIHEELAPHPVSPYGASKLAGEGYCSAYYRTFGVNTVCLRFGNVYGPRSSRKSSVVAKFIRQALNGETCVVYGDGTQTRDFLYIDDLVQAVVSSTRTDVPGETFQIATGVEHTVAEVAQIIAEELTNRGVSMSIAHDLPRPGDVQRNFADTSKAKRLLAWEVETDLKAGISSTVGHFVEHQSSIA